MSFEIVFKEDYGHTVIILVEEFNEFTGVTSAVDISSFPTKVVIVRKPDKVIVELVANFVTDGTDGLLDTTVPLASNVFNQNGYYTFQARVQNTTQRFTSTTFGHDVKVPLS